jgi:hypothetical protein
MRTASEEEGAEKKNSFFFLFFFGTGRTKEQRNRPEANASSLYSSNQH